MPSLRIVALCVLLLCLCGDAQTPLAAFVSGSVTDSDAALLPNAVITLARAGSGALRVSVTDVSGHFSLGSVAPGSYTLSVAAPGFAVIRRELRLSAGQTLDLPAILLPVADAQDISVQPTRYEMAEADVKQQETQRALGVLPNFFVSYNWKAPPLATRQKFGLAWRSLIDPVTIASSGVFAGLQQATNSFPGYGQGAQGYFKRLGAVQADITIGNLLGGAVFPTIFRQDPRYFYKGTGSVWSRALYALSTAVICRGDNGRRQPNYSGILGDIATGAASNLYYASSDRQGASLTIANGLLNAAGDGVGNLIQELVVRHFTPNLPATKP